MYHFNNLETSKIASLPMEFHHIQTMVSFHRNKVGSHSIAEHGRLNMLSEGFFHAQAGI